jgi:hypothetical protein
MLVIGTHQLVYAENNETIDAQFYLNVIDSVSGKILVRVAHEHAVGPFHCVVLENFIFVAYWNMKVYFNWFSSM